MVLAILFLKIPLGFGSPIANKNSHKEIAITLGDLELKFLPYKQRNSRTGIVCLYGGEPFSIGSGFGISSLNWKESYLSLSKSGDFDVETEIQDKSKSIVIKLHGEGGQGHIRYTIKPDNILDIEFSVKLATKAGRISFDTFRLEPAVFLGLPLTAKLEDGKNINKRFAPFRNTEERLILLRNFQELSMISRLGKINITKLPGSNLPVQVADWRGKKWPPRPYLYLGTSAAVSKAGSENIVKLRVKFPKTPLKSSGITKFIENDKWKKGNIVAPVTNKCPQLYPTPKKVQWSAGKFKLSPQSGLVFKNVPAEDQRKLASILNGIVARKYDFTLNTVNGNVKDNRIELCLSKKLLNKSPEYYEISVNHEKIVIRAREPIGLRHGIRMLDELLWADPNNPAVICAEIADWPSLPMRGVHCFTGNNSVELHKKFIERIFSAAKFNNVVYECGYIKWDATPLAHFEKYGMEKTHAALVIAAMKANYIEPIPLIQSLGHIDWLNRNIIDEATGCRAYGEYLVSPSTYSTCLNPIKKDGQKFLEKVYDEVIEMFKPRYFHIGLDECFGGPAQLKALSKTIGISPEELFVKQLLVLHKYLADRNIRMMMWGDILLKRGEECPDYGHAPSLEAAKAMRQKIPKDVIIADWHYGNFKPEKYINIDVLQKDGFEVLGSTAYFPGNLIWFNAALKKAESLGYLHTTWAGFNFDNESLEKNFAQYYSYILGAEAAWNGDYAEVKDIPFSFDKKFVELWTKDDFSRFMKPTAKNWFVDLSDETNLELTGKSWLGMTAENAPGEIDTLASSNVKFQMTKDGRIQKAVLFDAKYNPEGKWPEKLVISVNRKINTLAFVQAASMKGKWDEKIASYVLTYNDGNKYTIPLRYGRNIFWYADTCNNRIWDNHNNPLIWQSQSKAGQPMAIRYLKVDNPYSDKIIKNITIESAGKGPGLILFGIAGFVE